MGRGGAKDCMGLPHHASILHYGDTFQSVYGSDAMIPVEIHESSPRFLGFVAEESNVERRVNLDLIDEAREEAKIKAEAVKRRVERQYSSKVKLRQSLRIREQVVM